MTSNFHGINTSFAAAQAFTVTSFTLSDGNA